MIVEVKFTNGMSGLYLGTFDVQTSLSKSDEGSLIRDDLKKDRTLKSVLSSKPKLNSNLVYWEAVEPLVCESLQAYGFRVCR